MDCSPIDVRVDEVGSFSLVGLVYHVTSSSRMRKFSIMTSEQRFGDVLVRMSLGEECEVSWFC